MEERKSESQVVEGNVEGEDERMEWELLGLRSFLSFPSVVF